MLSGNGSFVLSGGWIARSTPGSALRPAGSPTRAEAPCIGSGSGRAAAADPAGGGRESGDDAAVVARVLAGDAAAYAELVARNQSGLYRFATGMLGDSDLAADVVQEAFIKAYVALPRCRSPQRFGAWIRRILLNRCRDVLRGRRNVVPLEDVVVAAPAADGASARAASADLRAAVDRALATLPESQREAFLLRHVEGRDYEEIAEMLGTSVGAVKMRVMRARESLQEQLEDWRP